MRQVESYPRDMGMTGLVSVWAMASRGPEGYGHDGHGVCLDDGQTEADGVPSKGRRVRRGDALLRRMPPYMT